MTPNKQIRGTFILMVLLFLPIHTVYAADDIDRLKPNEYKKNDLEYDPNSLRQGDEIQNLPEEFQGLDFKRTKKKEENELNAQLFKDTGKKKTTLASQVKELHLFSAPPVSVRGVGESVASSKVSSTLKWTLGGVLFISIILLFALLLPRILRTSEK